jgi:hypothetical protein
MRRVSHTRFPARLTSCLDNTLTWDLFPDLDEVVKLRVLSGDGGAEYARVRFKSWMPGPRDMLVSDPESVQAIKSYLASERSRSLRASWGLGVARHLPQRRIDG